MEVIRRAATMLNKGDAIYICFVNERESSGECALIYIFSVDVVDILRPSFVQNLYERVDEHTVSILGRINTADVENENWFFVPEEEYTAQCVEEGDERIIGCWGEDKEEVVRVLDEWMEKKNSRRKAE